MAGGLAALLDDVAMIAKMASATSTKAMGVVVDDAAVTPRYVQGFSPARELPIIGKIALGSLRNKLVFILPVALLLSQYAPWLLTPILMLGGLYLVFEGAEKIWEAFSGHSAHGVPTPEEPVVDRGPEYEARMVRGAITTDFILSAEIMVISLDAVAQEAFWPRAITLVVVAIGITALVYGVVAVLVKLDDIGLRLMTWRGGAAHLVGRALVAAMPKIMALLATVGIAAMLWVGGHILVVGADALGWHAPLELIHRLAEPASHVAGAGGFLAWLVDTVASALVGLVIGAVIVGVVHLIPHKGRGDEPTGP